MPGSKSSDPASPGARADAPLGLTVHALPDPARAVPNTARGRWRVLLILLVCAAPVLASYFMHYVVTPTTGSAAYGELIQPSVGLPDVPVIDLDGRSHALRDLRHQWLLVVVGPGDCAGDCERRLFLQRQLREMLGRERARLDKLWLVSDQAAVAAPLRAVLESTSGMLVRRLPREAVQAWLRAAPGQLLEDQIYLIDPMGEWMMRWPATAEPMRIKRDLDRLLRAAASWDQPGRP